MRILAIDPGSEQSAFVLLDDGRLERFGKLPNEQMRAEIDEVCADRLAVEMIASYGMPVGAEVFQTCVWIGRFVERWPGRFDASTDLVYRKDVKMHLCGQTKGVNDAVIRQALIDRFGPGKDRAIGKKASPGPLYGLTADAWAALAVGVTYADLRTIPVEITA
jgi:hypothetical protein